MCVTVCREFRGVNLCCWDGFLGVNFCYVFYRLGRIWGLEFAGVDFVFCVCLCVGLCHVFLNRGI